MKHTVVYRNGKLEPASKYDEELMQSKLKNNQRYDIEVKKARNYERLQLYWVTMKRIAELESCEDAVLTDTDVHTIHKMAFFGVETKRLYDREYRLAPSVSFERITNEKEFEPYFDWIETVIKKRYNVESIDEFLAKTEGEL